MSRRRLARSRKKTRPIILPQSVAATQGPEGVGPHTKQIQDLIDLLRKNQLTELEWERQGLRIRVRHEVAAKTVAAPVQDMSVAASFSSAQSSVVSSPSADDTAGLVTVTSPIVGTFYRSPSPDADPYVEEGDFVKKGQVLCIVEAMKLMNEIESETDGRIVKILAESTKPVEYGQALFLVDPNATP